MMTCYRRYMTDFGKPDDIHASPRAWLGAWLEFGYVFSMFAGVLFWYKGLAMGGSARVGQVPLPQPFLTLAGAAAILGETLEPRHALFAAGSRMSIRR